MLTNEIERFKVMANAFSTVINNNHNLRPAAKEIFYRILSNTDANVLPSCETRGKFSAARRAGDDDYEGEERDEMMSEYVRQLNRVKKLFGYIVD